MSSAVVRGNHLRKQTIFSGRANPLADAYSVTDREASMTQSPENPGIPEGPDLAVSGDATPPGLSYLASIHRSRLKLHAGLDFGVWAGSGQEGSPGLATRRVPLQILVSRRCWLVGQATA